MRSETVKIGNARIPWPMMAAAIGLFPVLSVLGLRHLKHSPQSAMADDNAGVGVAFLAPPPPQVPADSVKVAGLFSAEVQQGFGPSPMINRAPALPPKPVEAKAPVEVETPMVPQSTVPELAVSSVMSSSQGFVAVVNGKLRRIGDAVGGGFTISRITSDLVEISNEAGDHVQFVIKH